MLPQDRLPAQRTFWLFPDPISNASPTKYMPTSGDTRVSHFLQTQRALPLLPSLYPANHLWILEVVSWLLLRNKRSMCHCLDTLSDITMMCWVGFH